MTFVRATRGEEEKVGSTIVLGEVILVIAGPDDRSGDAQFGGVLLERGPVLSVSDDHHANAGTAGAKEREGAESILEAAAGGELSDDGNELLVRPRIVLAEARAFRVKLAEVERWWCERSESVRKQARVAEGLVDDEDQIGSTEQMAREGIVAQNPAGVKRPRDPDPAAPSDGERDPVVIGEVGVEDVEPMRLDQPADGRNAPAECERILRLLDDGVRVRECADLRLETVAADIGVGGIDAGFAKSLDFGEGRCRSSGPAVPRGEMKDVHDGRRFGRSICYSPRMAVDAELLEILACPLCKQEVKLVPLSEERRTATRDKFREKFRGEEPVVEQGLQCVQCHRTYPIVSDIPVMLLDEAFD